MSKYSAEKIKHFKRQHAKKRALQRFGLELNRHDLRELVNMILTGKTLSVSKKSNRISIATLNYRDIIFDVVFDKKRKLITTFLFL